MVPLLALLGDVIGLAGGYIAINIQSSVSLTLYFNKCISAISFTDLLPAFIKTIFFGFAIGFIGCYKGYNSNRGTESVGLSANSAVVASSLWIFVIDAIVVQISNILFY
jgi:phospholipid/cholesterol/gamma-HCH transport system permease protein